MMRCVCRDDCRIARAEDPFGTVDRDGEPAGGHGPDLFLWVVMLMDRYGIDVNLVGRDRHVLRMKETSPPAREWLCVHHFAGVDERHGREYVACGTRRHPLPYETRLDGKFGQLAARWSVPHGRGVRHRPDVPSSRTMPRQMCRLGRPGGMGEDRVASRHIDASS